MRHLRLGVAFGIVVILAWLPMERAHADFGGWATQGMVNNTGACVQFSYAWGTATQTIAVNSEVSGATFSATIDNSITNTIGRPEPTADSYSMSLALIADGATVSTASLNESTIHGPEARTITAAYTGRVDSAILTIRGIDNGFWGGWYGPTFCGPSFSWDASVVPSPSASPTPETSTVLVPVDTSTPVVDTLTASTPSPSPSPSVTQSPDPLESPSPSPAPTSSPTESPSPTPPQNNVVNGSTSEGGELTLSAPIGKIFTSVLFASYGTPNGYSLGQCHATNTVEKIAEVFLGKAIATIMAINDIFGDPCGGIYKSLAVSLIYGDDPQAVTPSPSPSPTPSPDTSTVVTPTPEPSVTHSPSPSPTSEPSASPSPTPLPPVVEPPRPQPTQEPAPSTPEPTPSASPDPEPSPTPSPSPSSEPSPEPSPSPTPEASIEPSPSPSPTVEPTPSSTPKPDISASPQTIEPTPTAQPQPSSDSSLLDVKTEAIVDSALADGKLSKEEKKEIAGAVIEQFAGEPVPASALAEAGITYADLPPETPVEVRTDAEGNPIVITAEVADALELVTNPADMVGALFSDPGKALMALANIGADMSPVERKESQQVIVASVIVASIATLSIRRI